MAKHSLFSESQKNPVLVEHKELPQLHGASLDAVPSVTKHGRVELHIFVDSMQARPALVKHKELPQLHGASLNAVPSVTEQEGADMQIQD